MGDPTLGSPCGVGRVRLIAPVLKTGDLGIGPGVQIPHSAPGSTPDTSRYQETVAADSVRNLSGNDNRLDGIIVAVAIKRETGLDEPKKSRSPNRKELSCVGELESFARIRVPL